MYLDCIPWKEKNNSLLCIFLRKNVFYPISAFLGGRNTFSCALHWLSVIRGRFTNLLNNKNKLCEEEFIKLLLNQQNLQETKTTCLQMY